ncbi:hypothetical protein [Phaeocystidibacter luteus]|uniref:Uncharacterized protein n=1 Tax=Phaeocystidibacter luteus TaxID=911197 RepID=A0A6N6RFF8_9FLAO|nr:hypothetical protein [Phaeocystidibacter luteus]KAB2809882.1 hypothetical protein F8C67_08350 [Phaeocystidibacter luteus]
MKFFKSLAIIIAIIMSGYFVRKYYTVVVYTDVDISSLQEFGAGKSNVISPLKADSDSGPFLKSGDSVHVKFDGVELYQHIPTLTVTAQGEETTEIYLDAETIEQFKFMDSISDSVKYKVTLQNESRAAAVAVIKLGSGYGWPLWKSFYYKCKVSYYGVIPFVRNGETYSGEFKFERVYVGDAIISGLVSEEKVQHLVLNELGLEEQVYKYLNILNDSIADRYDCALYLDVPMNVEVADSTKSL